MEKSQGKLHSLVEIDHLRKALEAEAGRKKRVMEDKDAPKPAMDEITDTTTSDPSTSTSTTKANGPVPGIGMHSVHERRI